MVGMRIVGDSIFVSCGLRWRCVAQLHRTSEGGWYACHYQGETCWGKRRNDVAQDYVNRYVLGVAFR